MGDAVGGDAMLKTLVYSGKPNYGFGAIAVMVKPSLYFLREPCQALSFVPPSRRTPPLFSAWRTFGTPEVGQGGGAGTTRQPQQSKENHNSKVFFFYKSTRSPPGLGSSNSKYPSQPRIISEPKAHPFFERTASRQVGVTKFKLFFSSLGVPSRRFVSTGGGI